MIKVHQEPIKPGPAKLVDKEHCCFCWKTTTFWCEKDVAVCVTCAEIHDLAEVPTKKEWCAEFDRRFPRVVLGYHAMMM